VPFPDSGLASGHIPSRTTFPASSLTPLQRDESAFAFARDSPDMDYVSRFNMPVPLKITGRSSRITNACVNSFIPAVPPSSDEMAQALEILTR
jgi:hypothetical protein